MGRQNRQFEIFTQPAFLVAIVILLVNDLYLKAHHPSWLTGKLSDFAGLYVFTQFVAVTLNVRIVMAASVSGVLFIAWKTPLVTPLISFVNEHTRVRLHRTIDYTDLLALLVLPIAVRLYAVRSVCRWNVAKYAVAGVTLLAIMGTSVITPSYSTRFQMRELLNSGTQEIRATYAKVDQLLTSREMQCVSCNEGKSYREYRDVNGDVTVQLNYDSLDHNIFVSVHTRFPDRARAKIDELQTELMTLLRTRFENVTVNREASRYVLNPPTEWKLKVEVPAVGFPLSCAGNGAKHPEINNALRIVDEMLHSVAASAPRYPSCGTVDSRCSQQMCREVVFGRVIGPGEDERSIRLSTRGYVGWGGTSFYIEVSERDDSRGVAAEFVRALDQRLRASLSPGSVSSR